MKSKLLFILVIMFFVFDLGLLIYYYQNYLRRRPVAPSESTQTKSQFLPNVRLTKLEIDRDLFIKDATTKGAFTLTNLDDAPASNISVVSDIYFALENKSLDMVSEQASDKTISLKPKETKVIPFTHPFSNRINSGDYFVTVNIVSQTGLPLTQLSSVVKDVVGVNRFLEIDWKQSKIVSGQDEELSPLAGPNFEPQTSPRVILTVKNPHAFPIAASPEISIFARAAVAGSQPMETYKEDLITFAPNSEKKLEFNLHPQTNPESYLAYLKFLDEAGQPASGLQQFRWVVNGPSGKILSVKALSGEKYFGKVKLTVEASVVGPADSTRLKDAKLELKLFSSNKTETLLTSVSKNTAIDPQPKKLVFPVEFAAKLLTSPSIRVKANLLALDDNLLLHAIDQTLPITLDQSRQNRFILTVVSLVLIAVLGLFVLWFFWRRPPAHFASPPANLLLFFIIILSALFFLISGSSNISASTSVSCNRSSEPKCQNTETYIQPTFSFNHINAPSEARVNDDVTATGAINVVSACSNAVTDYVWDVYSSSGVLWYDSYWGVSNFIATGLAYEPGVHNIAGYQQLFLYTPSNCFPGCNAGEDANLPITIKDTFYFCDNFDNTCRLTGTYYKDEAECAGALGETCYADGSTCQASCLKPPTPGPTIEGESHLTCDPNGSGYCIRVPGAGGNSCALEGPDPNCATNPPEAAPTPRTVPPPDEIQDFHLSCLQVGGAGVCARVDGPGPSFCTTPGATCPPSWSPWSPSAGCGLTNQTKTCSCSGECCAVNSAGYGCEDVGDGGGAAACNNSVNRQSCFSQVPNNTPDITSVSQPTAALGSTKHDGGNKIQSLDVAVFWKFQEGDAGCNNKPWGFAETSNFSQTGQCNNANQQNKFVVKIYNPSGTLIDTKDLIPPTGQNGNKSYSVNTVNNKVKTAGGYTVDVCANNGYGERCYSQAHGGNRFPFQKVKVPTQIVKGKLQEHYNVDQNPPNNLYCKQGIANGLELELVPDHAHAGIKTAPCLFTTAPGGGGITTVKTDYTCTINYDNENVDIPTVTNFGGNITYFHQPIRLRVKNTPPDTSSITLKKYGFNQYYCVNSGTCNLNLNPIEQCEDGNNNKSTIFEQFDQNAGNALTAPTADVTTDTLFDKVNTGADAVNYYKLKNAQYVRGGGDGVSSIFPAHPEAFDNEDNGGAYFLTGQPGSPLVSPFDTAQSTLGSGLSNGPRQTGALDSISFKKWENNNYAGDFNLTPTRFLDYLKSRKEIQTSSALPGSFTSGKIYVINATAPVILNDSQLNADKFIIIVNGADLKLTPGADGSFNKNPSPRSIIFISTNTLGFDPSIADAYGAFMGQDVSLGDTTATNLPLKIKGNLISVNPVDTDPLTRRRTDNQRPSLFVVFDAKPYMELLKLLSIHTYTWSQLVP